VPSGLRFARHTDQVDTLAMFESCHAPDIVVPSVEVATQPKWRYSVTRYGSRRAKHPRRRGVGDEWSDGRPGRRARTLTDTSLSPFPEITTVSTGRLGLSWNPSSDEVPLQRRPIGLCWIIAKMLERDFRGNPAPSFDITS